MLGKLAQRTKRCRESNSILESGVCNVPPESSMANQRLKLNQQILLPYCKNVISSLFTDGVAFIRECEIVWRCRVGGLMEWMSPARIMQKLRRACPPKKPG